MALHGLIGRAAVRRPYATQAESCHRKESRFKEAKFEVNAEDVESESATVKESARRSQALCEDLPRHPAKYRVLTGERPTGPLHIGHLFGTVANRVRIQNLGGTTFIVIADYQVLTDRDTADAVGANVHEVVLDYLASGLDPENGRTFFFSHSHVPELNQLLLPFMSLVTAACDERLRAVRQVSARGRLLRRGRWHRRHRELRLTGE